MTVISNDPSWWPTINAYLISSYFIVAACVVVMYDWGLTFGQEVELVWRQRWSMMTVLYLIARYVAIEFSVINMLSSIPTIVITDAGCLIIDDALNWMSDVVEIILGIIIIVRLHAMYQQSRKVLIFLVVIFLAIRIANVVMVAIITMHISAEEYVLSGTYECKISYTGDSVFLGFMTWILDTIWEVLALCLAIWIAVKHFRELRRHSAGGIIGDCFTVLMQTHIGYFASFVAVSCFQLILFSPTVAADAFSLDTQIYIGFSQIFDIMQLSVLGPRLILSVREYHAKLVADSDTATAMSSMAFQEHVHMETSSDV